MPILEGASGSRRPARPDAVYVVIAAVAISAGIAVFAYVPNYYDDSVSSYAVDAASGRLKFIDAT